MDLIADIGGTNARCALIDSEGRTRVAQTFANADFASLGDVLAHFIESDCSEAPTRAALAVAGPIDGDSVTMTNIDWQFSVPDLEQRLGLDSVFILNDFEALAHGLPLLTDDDCRQIGPGQSRPGAALAVIGPGTGLGVATLVRHGDSWVAVAGEGGHVSAPALNEVEAGLVREYADETGHCPAEMLVSGPGLVRIYQSLGRQASATPTGLTPADVTQRASAGEPLAVETFNTFFSLLGTIAGNLALTVGARGGVFIGGGIAPRVADQFAASGFRERFIGKGYYRAYLDAIPTAIITAEQPAFIGLKAILTSN